ncbi:MAG: hypothetical protein ACOYNO_09640 [Saprospiraceae bacterium]|jgi:hypothetical protein
MDTLLQNSMFYWIIWSVATLIGVVLGWSLRFLFSEKSIAQALDRSEQDRNALARLYTQLKHQYDLREADLKKNAIEVAQLRHQAKEFDMLRALHASEKQADAARLDKAEQRAQYLLEKTAQLEAHYHALRNRYTQMMQDMQRKQEEVNAWKNLHRDFAGMQRQLRSYEKATHTLDHERRQLLEQLHHARLEIENLQSDLLKGVARPVTPDVPVLPPVVASGERAIGGRDARPSSPDDLKIINGISPFAERQLNALGIFTFDQISRWDDATILSMAKSLGLSPARILQDDWMGQARHLLEQSL